MPPFSLKMRRIEQFQPDLTILGGLSKTIPKLVESPA